MFRADIKIYDEIGIIDTNGKELFFSDDHNMLRVQNGVTEIFTSMASYSSFVFETEGLWLNYGMRSEKSGTAKFVDIYNKSISYPDLETGASYRHYFTEKNIIGVKPRLLFDASKKNGVVRKKKGKYHLGIVVLENKVFARERDRGLVCYDMEFKETWCVPFEKTCFTGIFDGPQNYENLIIINVGEKDTAKRGEFELNAYAAEDGSLVWQVVLPTSPGSSNVIGDKVYVSVLDKIMVIDAATGNVLLEKPHGLRAQSHNLLFPYGNRLLVFSEADDRFHVFDEDGKRVQQIFLPENYMAGRFGFPVVYDGKLYKVLMLRNMLMRGTSAALLTLTPDEDADKAIHLKLPPEPSFHVSVVTTKDGENEHVVTVSHDDLDEIILYSTIRLKEIGVETSSSVDPSQRDPKHNGSLRLFVDPDPLEDPEAALEKLGIVKEKVEWYLKRHYETAGDDKRDFTVLIELK